MEIDVILDDSGDAQGYLTKGHIESVALLSEIRKQFDDEFHPDSVEHTTMRLVPTPHETQYDARYYKSGPGRGAFKCTVAWADWR